jgi:general secretion pathway protein D
MVRSNQTIVIGGLMQEVETESESKVPILGDIPLIGFFFRNKAKTKRKTNLLIFLTPHVIDSPEDLQEVYKIKMLQRQEFMRRFYGKSHEDQLAELNKLISFSMNLPDSPSAYRHQESTPKDVRIDMSVGPVDEELLEALGEVDAGEQSTLVTADGEATIPEDQDTQGAEDDSDSASGAEDLQDSDSEAEGSESAGTEEEEPEPDPVEAAPTEEG